MRRFYDKTLVETYLRQTKHESIMRGLQEHLFVAQYEKGEFITMPLQQEHLFQIITHTSHTKNRHIIGSYATLGI